MKITLDLPSENGIIITVTSTTLTFLNPVDENNHLKARIAEFEALTQGLESLVESLQSAIRNQQHRMEDLLKRLYGRSSEKLDPNQLLMQDILLEADKNTVPKLEEPQQAARETVVAAHTRRHHGRQALPEHLRRVEHILDVPGDDKTCTCGKTLNHIGDDVTERIEYQPSSLFVNAYVRPKYACGDCNCDGIGVKQHVTPEGPIERCEADAGMLAHVIEEKFEHHTPLYRQELKLERQGVNISRQTMADWMAGCAWALKPLYELMRQEVLAYDIVLNDDTPVDMRYGPDAGIRTSRFWVTVGGENQKYTMYNFTLGRGSEGPEEFFKGYKGYFVSDAYAGYNELFKIKVAEIFTIINSACWTHARRYFIKAQDSAPRAATEMLTLIAKLYKIEDEIKHKPPDQKLAVRWKESALIIQDKIKAL